MSSDVAGRVLIAPDDPPLEPHPTWVRLDSPSDYPDSFIAGYDLRNGRQTLMSQTDTGTATIYVNDHKEAIFDPRNSSSPLYGKVDGKQIMLQLYDPVLDVWEPQFRGLIDSAGYVIGPETTAQGVPVNANVTINCVDMFDYLAGFGLTPGLAGDRPPKGGENGVWYAQQASDALVWDRIIQILADCGVDPDMSVIFSGNVNLQTVRYDPDESALIALRDCADAEFPFISNIYVDRFGRFVFHGRYARFDPAGVAADAAPGRWDFQYLLLGDGVAVQADPTRTQIRVLEFAEARANIVNVAICYPQGIKQEDMINQIYADTTSINDFGHYTAPPMSDLLTQYGSFDGVGRYIETFRYAELLVKNQKDPREAITALQLKAIHPDDPRAPNVWWALTHLDVSDMVNVAVGYPGGVGLTGSSPADDYFVEGREMRVRPLTPEFDYVELDLEVSPAVWSQDTHGVFPSRGSSTRSGPAASFDMAISGLTVTVTDTSSAGLSGPITDWVWDWGDGNTSTGQSPSPHTYASVGLYSVTLTVVGTGSDGSDATLQALVLTGDDWSVSEDDSGGTATGDTIAFTVSAP